MKTLESVSVLAEILDSMESMVWVSWADISRDMTPQEWPQAKRELLKMVRRNGLESKQVGGDLQFRKNPGLQFEVAEVAETNPEKLAEWKEQENRERKTGKKQFSAFKDLSEAGQVCSHSNMNEETMNKLESLLTYLEEYAGFLCGQNEKPIFDSWTIQVGSDSFDQKQYNPFVSAWRKRRGDDSKAARTDLIDEMVCQVAAEIYGIVENGSDHKQEFPTLVSDNWGNLKVGFKPLEAVFHNACNGAAYRLLKENGASVNISATAEGNFDNIVDDKGNERNVSVSDKSKQALQTMTGNKRKAMTLMLDQSTVDSEGNVSQPSFKHIATTLGIAKDTVGAAKAEFEAAFNSI